MLITITDAGRTALINAENTGMLPALVAGVGVTSTGFEPDKSMTSLPGEVKRLSTFAGQTIADDTIHVTIRDETADDYIVRGFGLYLDDGTLLAVYGQPEPLLEKSPQAMLLLSADIRLSQIQATALAFGDSNWLNPPATTEAPGVVELATDEEANDGTDGRLAVTPTGLSFAFEQRGAFYLDWNNFRNVPSVFPPGAHQHSASEIEGAATVASGSFSGRLINSTTGAAVATGTIHWRRVGTLVTLVSANQIVGTINGFMQMLDVPAEVNPSRSKSVPCVMIVSSARQLREAFVTDSRVVFDGSFSNASGLPSGWSITYDLT